MRRAALLAIGLAGCNQVLGLEPPSGHDGGAVDARAIDAIDAAPCEGSISCFTDEDEVYQTACADAPVSACSADQRFAYCRCGVAPTPQRAVFAVPALANPAHTDLILVAEPGLRDLEVLMGGCYGPAVEPCDLDVGVCAGSNRTMYVWPDLPKGPGDYGVTIFVDDVAAPCTTKDGGTILVDVSVAR